ncbi:hypothetical protein [Nocardia terpenica]|uniref:DUF4254 domain-containing protein n=1 Tax=Nocardia terpenica TaxID=455432 RepID=A0A291RI40_9NOCA|nr:hypothetical protein [Nocardia terpenica]ATL67236.1 hypothetical protein CRH09_14560 [Nocardia terpenica]
MLLALFGHQTDDVICGHAQDLVDLHRKRREQPERAAEFDCGRAESVAAINRRATGSSPRPHPAVDTHSETLGSLIDRTAAATERAIRLLATTGPSTVRMHEAWTRLAELEIAYGDLVAKLTDDRRLPRV